MTIPGQDAVPLQVYKISRSTFLGELLKLFLLSVIAVVVSIFASAAGTFLSFRMLGIDEDSILVLFLLIGFFSGSLFLGWKLLQRYFQFELRIHGDRLETSALWFRNHLATDAVETIQHKVQRDKFGGVMAEWVELVGGGKAWALHFGMQIPDCIDALRTVCHNAVYIDAEEQEHLPTNTRQPQKTLSFLLRHRRRKGIMLVLLGSMLFLWSAPIVVWKLSEIIQGIPDKVMPPVVFFLFPIISLFLVYKGIVSLREAAKAKEAMKQYRDQGYHDNVLAAKPVDLSKLNKDR